MEQPELGAFDQAANRPAGEAAAVAGDGGLGAEVVDTDDASFPDADGHVDVHVTQVDYTVAGTGDEEYPVVHVFGRRPDGTAEHIEAYGFRPYFYIPLSTLEREPGDGPPRASAVIDDRIVGESGLTGLETRADRPDLEGEDDRLVIHEGIRGEELVKVFGRTPRDVGNLRGEFDHYEADILFPNRFLIDKDVTTGVRVPARRTDDGTIRIPHVEVEPASVDAPQRVGTIDIEVDDRSGFPEDGEEPIICLTTHDSFTEEYVVWHYRAPDGAAGTDEITGYEPIDGAIDVSVRSFDTEEAMLAAVLEYVETTDPDVLTGWNFTDFDAPYLIDRIESLTDRSDGLDANRLSRVDEIWRSDWQGPNVKGRVVFDLLYAYRRTQFSELESYRLDAVGETELGVGKERYPGDVGDLWEEDPGRLLEYNLRDVELCVELDRKQDIIAFWEEVASFVGCRLEDATTPGDAVDMFVLHKLHGEYALPSKGQQEGEQYEGGAVFEPISGLRDYVTVLDLKSLYPMAMVTTNASPETKVDPATYEGDTYRAPNGTHFRKDPDGVIREMVDELLSEREEKKARRNEHDPESQAYERFDRQQAAVKVIMNCFTPDTEVVTPDGVRNIRDLEVGDDVYSVDPDTNEMEIKPVVDTHAYPEYRGELLDIETDAIDLRVTPNHRMLVRTQDANGSPDDRYSFVEAGALDRTTTYGLPHDWDGPGGTDRDVVDLTRFLDDYRVWIRPDEAGHTVAAEIGCDPETNLSDDGPGEGYVLTAAEFERHRRSIESVAGRTFVQGASDCKWLPRTYDADDFLHLLAWYVTEGTVDRVEDPLVGEEPRGSARTVELLRHERAVPDGGERDHARIGTLLDRLGVDYSVDDGSYRFTSELLVDVLRACCGDDRSGKRMPAFVFGLCERQKRLFLNTLIDGDGDRRPNAWRYTTSSERFRDDLLRLCAHLGLAVRYTHDSGSWHVSVTENATQTLRMDRSASRTTADDGVYCVTVADNHTLLAGRNGTFQFVGQSLYGVLGWDRFRLYDREMGAAVTATGREVIEYTDDVASSDGFDVVYGDTDSVMLAVGQVGPDDVDGEVDVTEAMREKHPDLDDDELASIVATIEKGFELEDAINESYDEFALERLNAEVHRFEIEFEKLYRRFFQAGKKKRYAGHIVWKEGNDVDDIDITGFEYKRSDIAPITKEVQREVIQKIVTGEPLEEVTAYVHDVIEGFQSGTVDLDEVAIPGGIGKRLDNYDTDTAHVRGAKYANLLLGTNFQRGAKPKRVYLEKVHPEFFRRVEAELGLDPSTDPLYAEFKRDPDVICFEYADQVPEEFEVDWDEMLEKTLRGPIARIFEALDLSWEEVKSGQEQTGLGQYT